MTVIGDALARWSGRVVFPPELMALSTFAGGRLWGGRYGTGPPWVLALHGWGRDHHDFDPVLAGLDAVSVDLPGHGVVPDPPGPWSTADYARHIAPVLDDLADRPVVVLGHSFGARVAVHLATAADAGHRAAGTAGTDRRPRIGALVLTGAPLAPAPGWAGARLPLAYRAGRALHRARLLSDQQMEQMRRQYGSDDYRRATEVMRGVLVKAVAETASAAYMPLLRAWAAAGGPVELVWGGGDEVASLAAVKGALAAPPSAPAGVAVTVVDGAGHLINAELAVALRAAVLRHQSER